jgi:hypothetical protein
MVHTLKIVRAVSAHLGFPTFFKKCVLPSVPKATTQIAQPATALYAQLPLSAPPAPTTPPPQLSSAQFANTALTFSQLTPPVSHRVPLGSLKINGIAVAAVVILPAASVLDQPRILVLPA